MRRTRAVVVGIALLSGAAVGQAQESALDVHLREHPGALEEGSLGPLEARVLQALTPEQAEAYGSGTDPSAIVLASGETLADFMATLLAGGAGLVYVPLDACRAFQTLGTAAGPFAADESREYFVRGADLSAQGGSATGCMVPAEAVAVVMHFRTVLLAQGVAGRLRVKQAGGVPLAQIVIEYLRQGDLSRRNAGMSVIGLCEGTCASGELEVTSEAVPANIWGTVIGYFRPLVAADAPSVGDADTLDGLDSTDLALVTHTHDGGDIVSGIVSEPFIDPLIARDSEIVPLVLANDGAGSTLDADLLDGKELTAFRPRPANVILVDPTDGDYATIQGALDDIGAALPAATSGNRYLIRVGAGEYAEQVTMKPFVDIEGKGRKVTTIRATAGSQTLLGASDAELRHLQVVMEVAGGQASSVAIRNDGSAAGGGSTRLTQVVAAATGGTVENTGIVNDNLAAPLLDHVTAAAGAAAGLGPVIAGVAVVTDIGVVNQNGATPILRDSRLAGSSSAIENRDTATARIANTELAGDADVVAPAVQSSFTCVRVYAAGTLTRLNEECNPNTPPMATDDSYATLGNTLLEVTLDHAGAASALNTTATQPSVIGETTTPKTYRSVFENDSDAESPKSDLTAAVVVGTVTAGASLNMYADGTFEYMPPVGFTGADTFDYTVSDPGGLMDTGTVTINVSSRIWYVDNTNAGTADGRSTTPYTSLAPVDSGGADDGKDGTGDTIFVFTGSGSTGDGILLETNQVLHGNEIALAPVGFQYAGGANLVAAATAPTIANAAGDVVELASGNTVRGLDIAATNGRAIFGNASAGATIVQVGTTGTGSGTGVRFANATGSFSLTDLDVTSSTGAGIDIQGGSATFTFDSLSSVTSPSGTAFNVSGGSANVDFNGTITQTNAAMAINVSGAIGGTRTFDGPVTATTGSASAVNLNGTGTTSFTAGLNIDTTTGTGLQASGGGMVNVVATGGDESISTTAGKALDVDGAVLGVTFDAVTSTNSPVQGIELDNISGTLSINTGTITGAVGTAFEVGGPTNGSGGSATVVYAGSVTNTTGRSVGIEELGGGSVTLSGNINDTGSGILVNGINNGPAASVTFSGANSVVNTGANTGINLTNNTNGTVTFSGGGLDIDTTTATGFNATGGAAAINVTGMGNSITTTTGTALNIVSSSIGASGLTFQSISSNGGPNPGIVLNDTGSSGGLTVTGDGSTGAQGGNDSGGVIQNKTGDGVVLTSAQDITLRNMTIGDTTATPANPPDGTNNVAGDGVQATGVTDLGLLNVTIARTGGHGVNAVSVGGAASITNLTVEDSLILNAGDGQEEHGLNLDELRGDNFVRDSLFDAFNETGLELINTSGTVDLTVDNTTFQDNQATVGNAGEEAILIEAQGTASVVVLVTGTGGMGTGSVFDDISRQAIQAISLGMVSNIQLTVQNSRFVETGAGDGVIIMNPDNSGDGNVTVKNNTFTDDTFGPFAVLAKNDSSGTLDVTIQGNVVTNMQLLNVNHDNLGSGGPANGTSRVLVGGSAMAQGNTVTVGSNNIAVDVIATETPLTGAGPDLSLTAMNNTTSQPDNMFTFTPGLRVDGQNASRVNLNLSGNSFQGDPSTAGGSGIEVRELDTAVVGLQGFAGGTAAAAQTFIDTANPGSAAGSFVTSHDNNIGSGTATLPTATTLPNP